MKRLLALLLLLVAGPAWANTYVLNSQLEPCTDNQQVKMWRASTSSWVCVTLPTADFLCDFTAQSCPIATDIPRCGAELGATDCWRPSADGGLELQGTAIRMPQGTSTVSAECDESEEQGRLWYETDTPLDPLLMCEGRWQSLAGRVQTLGGDGSDGDFSQQPAAGGAGCQASDCDDSCSACNGTRPACTCVLPANSAIGRYNGDSGTTLYSCVYNFDDFTITGGTVTCGQEGAYSNTGAPSFGASMIIRVRGTFLTFGSNMVFDMNGKGMAGGAGGSDAGAAGNRNGGGGGPSSFFPGGSAGLGASSTAPGAGTQPPASARVLPIQRNILGVGNGGGGGAGSGTGAPEAGRGASVVFHGSDGFIGGSGGGGGYCTSSAGDTAQGGAGGRGGGFIYLELAGQYQCAGLTFTTDGVAGAAGVNAGAGGGGGGSGDVVIVARQFGPTDTCTYDVTTEGAGGSIGTNCSAGAAGAEGRKWTFTAPF